MKISYRDLSVTDIQMRNELLGAVENVLRHGRISLGPELVAFEEHIARLCKKKYAVGVSSGTDALYLSLKSLGVGPGDEVITTPLSWIATVNAIVLCGATPVFVDIGEDLNINADIIKDAVTDKTKAILPVHFTGRLCDMDTIMEIAGANNLYVVEDAAQAFGASRNGEVAGSMGHINCFSMNPMKIYCAYGEAGCIVTDDEKLYHDLISLRYAGTINKEDCHVPSLNGRLDTIQAAMMLVGFKYLSQKQERLQEIADFFTNCLKDIVTCPEPDGSSHAFYTYTIITPQRDELQAYLNSRDIETKIQHPLLMPHHSAYKNQFSKIKLPVANRLVKQILCIPNHEKLQQKELEYIVKTIKDFYKL